jgi:hypothetical protein
LALQNAEQKRARLEVMSHHGPKAAVHRANAPQAAAIQATNIVAIQAPYQIATAPVLIGANGTATWSGILKIIYMRGLRCNHVRSVPDKIVPLQILM